MEKCKRFALTIGAAAVLASSANAGWFEDTLSKVSVQQPNYFSSQVRGYMNFGGVQFASGWNGVGSIRPFYIQAPKIYSGCGGVSIEWGAFSYLKGSELIDKLKQLSNGIPSFVFNLALSVLCKDCQQILQELENIANSINSLNFDSCQAMANWGSALGGVISEKTGLSDAGWSKTATKALKTASTEVAQWVSNTNSWVNTANGTTTSNKNDSLATAFGYGSLIENYIGNTEKSSQFQQGLANNELIKLWISDISNTKVQIDLFRTLFGDLYGYAPDNCTTTQADGKQGDFVEYLPILPANLDEKIITQLFFDEENANKTKTAIELPIITIQTQKSKGCGELLGKPNIDYKKTLKLNNPAQSMFSYTKNKLLDMATKYENLNVNQADLEAFASSIPAPTISLLNLYIQTGRDETFLDAIAAYLTNQAVYRFINDIITYHGMLVNGARETTAYRNETQTTEFAKRRNYLKAQSDAQMKRLNDKFSQKREFVEEVQKLERRLRRDDLQRIGVGAGQ